MKQTLHFIGGGNMASAIIGGLERSDSAHDIVVVDPNEEVRSRHQARGHQTLSSLSQVRDATVLILAFKPQHFVDAAEEVAAALAENALVISILVGTSAAKIEGKLPGARVVRAMPNTPMMVGQGMTGVAPGAAATPEDMALAASLFEASGRVLEIREEQIDDIAAVSGSGPAYVFRFIEALLHAATDQCGFSPDDARLLVSETVQGAVAYLAAQPGYPAARLREQVTSKGGTTQAALGIFEEADLNGLVSRALAAAQSRAEELNNHG